MSEFVARRLRSGQTLRYHTTPRIGNGQTVAEHAWRATVLLHTLWPDRASPEALLYMLYHDAAEQELGDIPAPTKWGYPALAEHYTAAEREVERELELPYHREILSADEYILCKMADMLELVDHTAHRLICGDHSFEARNIYWNGRKHLLKTYGTNYLFPPAHKFLEHLHAQVVQVCPAAAAHVG